MPGVVLQLAGVLADAVAVAAPVAVEVVVGGAPVRVVVPGEDPRSRAHL